jgi:hypothetical protein
MLENVRKLMNMARWFEAHGEKELAAECRRTATAILDYVAWRSGK